MFYGMVLGCVHQRTRTNGLKDKSYMIELKNHVNEEKKEVAMIKVRRNFDALKREIPEFSHLSPERLAEIAGILAIAPL